MKKIKSGILFIVIFLAGLLQTYAQTNAADTTEPAITVLRFTCLSTSDDSVQLKSTVSVKRDDGNTNLANAPVIFYSVEKDGDLKIGEIKTDVHGTAILKIPSKPLSKSSK